MVDLISLHCGFYIFITDNISYKYAYLFMYPSAIGELSSCLQVGDPGNCLSIHPHNG